MMADPSVHPSFKPLHDLPTSFEKRFLASSNDDGHLRPSPSLAPQVAAPLAKRRNKTLGEGPSRSFFPSKGLRMPLPASFLVFVLLVVAAGGQSSSPPAPTAKSSAATPSPQATEATPTDDPKGIPLFGDDAKSELEFFESLMGDTEDDESKEESKKLGDDYLSVTVLYPDDDRPTDLQLRRQGDLDPEFGQRRTRPGVEFDDPKADDRFQPKDEIENSPTGRASRPGDDDGQPTLRLTQGGYQDPYKPSDQKQESESNSEAAPNQADANPNRPPYFRAPAPQYAFGPGPVLRSPFVAAPPRSYLSPNGILPTSVQNGFLNTPPAGFTDFTNFQAVFPNPIPAANFPNQMSLFQSPAGALLFQNPQEQQQLDPSRTLPAHLLSGSYEAVEDPSRPDYAAYFRHPTPAQFQAPPNYYGGTADFGHPFLANNNSPFSPRYIRYPADNPRQQDIPREEIRQQPKAEEDPNPNEPDRVPFGTRLQAPEFYMRYPIREAGYATEESLPLPRNNGTDEAPRRFFPRRPPFGRDPYRDALNALQQAPSTDSRANGTDEEPPFLRNLFPGPAFRPEAEFRNPAAEGETPGCALRSNASVCFEDKEYPRQAVHYALNSDSYLLDRFAMPAEIGAEESAEGGGRSICGAEVRHGAPLRARNAAGRWKVVVNVAEGRFAQRVRLEVCRSAGEPCSHTEAAVKTTCVQQYSVQSLLSWSTDRGVHSDLYRLPVACSCRLVDAS